MNTTNLIGLRKKQRYEFMTLLFVATGGCPNIAYRIPFDGEGGIVEKLDWAREDAWNTWQELAKEGLIERTSEGSTWLSRKGVVWIENAEQPATETAVPTPNDRAFLVALADKLNDHFDDAELNDLCFRLGEKYENIKGDAKPEKAVELVKYFKRRGRVEELVRIVQELRPNIPVHR